MSLSEPFATWRIYTLYARLKELRGAPLAILPSSMLPKLPERELFVKPVVYADNSFFAQFHADRLLTLEGKFTRHAGEKVTIMV